MKSFVVNLDRSPQRLEHISRLFSSMGVDFERIVAVDGKQLTQEQMEVNIGGEKNSPGAIGCYLSHRKCWEKIAAGKDEFAAVFEDDIHFSTLAPKFIGSDKWVPDNADIVKLETDRRLTCINKRKIALGHDGVEVSKLVGEHLRTGGYIISQRCASKLLEKIKKMSVEVDQALFNPRHGINNDLTIYQIIPALCIQSIVKTKEGSEAPEPYTFSLSDLEASRMQTRKIEKAKSPKYKKLIKEAVRPVRQFGNLINRAYTNAFTENQYIVVPFGEELKIADKEN